MKANPVQQTNQLIPSTIVYLSCHHESKPGATNQPIDTSTIVNLSCHHESTPGATNQQILFTMEYASPYQLERFTNYYWCHLLSILYPP